jgi:hypothetical protein
VSDYLSKKLLVKAILEKATNFEWSIQGFGMLRLYLSSEVRLHVWDDRYKVPNVSTIHDHPWHFHSYVVAGKLENQRFALMQGAAMNVFPLREPEYRVMTMGTIRCGVGGGLVKACAMGAEEPVVLYAVHREGPYTAMDSYNQRDKEIHESTPERGTVTIVERIFKTDTEHARVFWPRGEQWVSAEPRKATQEEILDITRYSLERWFS